MLLQISKFKSIQSVGLNSFLDLQNEHSENNLLVLYVCISKDEQSFQDITELLQQRKLGVSLLIIDVFCELKLKQIRHLLNETDTGLISGNISGDDVVNYIEVFRRIGWVISNNVKAQLLQLGREQEAAQNLDKEAYSQTEQKIIDAALRGLNIKQTAEEVGLSTNTVAVYRSKMMKRGGVRSIADLLRRLSVD